MWVRSLGQEDPLEEGMATHSSVFLVESYWTEEPGGLQRVTEVDVTEQAHSMLSLSYKDNCADILDPPG